MSRPIDLLREITEGARLAGGLGRSRGRYSRTPDYTAPAHPSSRPSSDRGTTFHFSHRTIAKGRDMAEGNRSQTVSAAHQGYIERPSAAERTTDEIRAALAERPSRIDGDLEAHQGYDFPRRHVDPRKISFGTLGHTPSDRKKFWDKVEQHERKNARVQNRIIAELPVELTPLERARVARDFCASVFEERGLPYWAALHAPAGKNDPRNFHLHIAYHDRPAGRNLQGEWDFEVTAERKKKSGNITVIHPLRRSKSQDVRAISWPRTLRAEFADACNFHLADAGLEKRLDPRSYQESGILKEPTEHLGNKLSALESFGLDTEPGRRNAKKEIRWRIRQSEQPWRDRLELLEVDPRIGAAGELQVRDELIGILQMGVTAARKTASCQIIADLLTQRINTRRAFLEKEERRLGAKDDLSDLADRSGTIISLSSEAAMLDDRAMQIELLATKSRQEAERQNAEQQRLALLYEASLARHAGPRNAPASDQDDLASKPRHDPFLGLTEGDLVAIDQILTPSIQAEPDKKPETEREPVRTEPAANPETAVEPGQSPSYQRSRKRDQLQEIIDRLTSDGNGNGPSPRGGADLAASDFPEAWALPASSDRADLLKLDARLRGTDNRTLRLAAVATRDATDLCPPGDLRQELNRGWMALRLEAERRGVDLDTGTHDPRRATDPERAHLHTDQDPCPIRTLQKRLSNQRVRG